MSSDDVTVIGPVEMVLIGFPGNRFDGSIVPALADMVESGTVRLIDLVMVRKDADGAVSAVEVSELEDDEARPLEQLDGEISELFNEDDLQLAGEQLTPNSSAALVLWENSWAAKLAAGVARSGGQILMHDRIPAEAMRDAVLAAQASA